MKIGSRMKRLFAMVLCLAMLLSVVPAEAIFATKVSAEENTSMQTIGVETKEIEVSEGEIVKLQFTAPESGKYAFYSTGSDDTYGYLYDADGNEIDKNDDSEGANFRLEFRLGKGETVLLGARYYNEKTSGSISVTVKLMPEFEIENGMLVAYNGDGGDVIIPDTVTEIGENVFAYKDSVTSVVIPEGVFLIGRSAFYDNGLASVTIPASMQRIEDSAFGGCGSLETLVYHGETKENWNAIWFGYNNDILLRLADEAGLGAERYYVNYNNTDRVYDNGNPPLITNYNSPFGLADVSREGSRFLGWYSDEELTVPVTEIDPATVTETVQLYASWEELPRYSISYHNIDGCDFDGREEYWEGASFVLSSPYPDDDESRAFDGWYLDPDFTQPISEITPETTGNLDLYAKWGLRVYEIHYYVVEDGEPEEISHTPTSCTSADMPLTLTVPTKPGYIFSGWYYDYPDDDSDPIPENTIHKVYESFNLYGRWIVDTAKAVQPGTWDVTLEAGDEAIYRFTPAIDGIYRFCSEGEFDTVGKLYDQNMRRLAQNDDGGTDNNFRIDYELTAGQTYYLMARMYGDDRSGTITLNLEKIEEFEVVGGVLVAYNGYNSNVVIPANVTAIGDNVFRYNYDLESVVIPEGVTRIGKDAFASCTQLTNVSIPASMAVIDTYAFAGCTELREVSYGGENWDGIEIGQGNDRLIKAYLQDSEGEPDVSKIPTVEPGKTEIYIPMDGEVFVKFAPEESGRYKIEALTAAGLLTEVHAGSPRGENLYSTCIGEEGYPTYVLSAGEDYYISLRYEDYRDSGSVLLNIEALPVFKISNNVLEQYYGVEKDVVIPDGVTAIGRSAFYETDIRSVVMPEGVTQIGQGAFECCYNLQSVTIPTSMSRIDGYAFYECDDLGEVNYGGSKAEWNRIIIGDGNGCLLTAARDLNDDRYTITYEMEGDRIIDLVHWADNPVSYTSYSPTIVLNEPAATGYRFEGWFLEDGTQVTEIPNGSSGDITLYSRWTEIPVMITYNLGSNGVNHPDNPSSSSRYSDPIPLKKPTREGYVFLGWIRQGEDEYTDEIHFDFDTPETILFVADWAYDPAYTGYETITTGTRTLELEPGEVKIMRFTPQESGVYAPMASNTNGYEVIWEIRGGDLEGVVTNYESLGSVSLTAGESYIIRVYFQDKSCGVVDFNLRKINLVGDFEVENGIALNYVGIGGDIVIPNGVKAIAPYLFAYRYVTSVTIPQSVEQIGECAFACCYLLEEVTYGGNDTQWSTITIEKGNQCLLNAKAGLPNMLLERDIDTVTTGTITLPLEAGYNNGVLFNVPQTGSYRITAESPVDRIWVEVRDPIDGESVYGGEDNTYALKAGRTYYIAMSYHKLDSEGDVKLTIDCLEEMEIVNNVLVRYNGTGINVVIPDNVTAIGERAFYDNRYVWNVTIPAGVRSVGTDAFAFCESLVAVTYLGAPEQWDNISIAEGNYRLKVAYCGMKNMPRKQATLGSSSFSIEKDETVYLQIQVEKSGQYPVYLSSGYVLYMFDSEWTRVYDSWNKVFPYLSSGEEYVIAVSAAGMHSDADTFRIGIGRGSEFVMEDGVLAAYMGDSPAVVIPSGVTSIAPYAFAGNSTLSSVTIPAGVTAIGESAFYNCTGLSKLTMPVSMTEIGDMAFAGCNALSTVAYSGTQEQWDAITIGDGNSALLKAKRTVPETYRIIYTNLRDADNSMNPTEFMVGDTVVLKDASRTGYRFGGWYADIACTEPVYRIDTTVAEDVTVYAKWTPVTYSITYNLNGGEMDGNNPGSYTIETPEIVLAGATLAECDFLGWVDAEGNEITSIPTGTTGNITLYAQWQATEYSITYDPGEGTNDESNPTSYTSAEAVVLKPARCDGYRFIGWMNDETGDVINVIARGTTGDLSLTAQWEAITYYVDYVSEGNWPEEPDPEKQNPEEYNVETELTALGDSERWGYKFLGWFKSDDTKVEAIGGGMTGDLTLYAKFEKETYYVHYELRGGVNNENNPTEFDVDTEAIELLAPTREGYTFDCWSVRWVAGHMVGDIYTTAYWIADEYSITYELNGGDSDGGNATTYTVEDAIVLQPAERDGFKFAGWYTDAELTQSVTEIKAGTTGDLTLYADWVGETDGFTVTYELNGGVNSTQNRTAYTAGVGLQLYDPQRTAYVFGGWFDNEACEGTAITAIGTDATGDITLYASWTPTEFRISYQDESSYDNAANSANRTFTVESADVVLAEPSRASYQFLGWYTDEAHTKSITTIEQGTVGDITLYPAWQAETYTITYVLDNGTNVDANPATYSIESGEIVLQDAVRNGYRFDGWYTDSELQNPITSIDPATGSGITLYAKWELETYTISYELNGGTGNTNPTSCDVTDAITLNDPERAYSTFGGWYTDSALTNRITEIRDCSSNLTLYAKWNDTEYTITYHVDGGSLSGETKTFTYYSDEVTLVVPTKAGYDFAGWYLEPGCKNHVDKVPAHSTGDINVYAKWDPRDNTITYVNDGTGNTNPTSYKSGESVSFDATPTRTGYDFAGWYIDGTKVTGIDAGTAGDITVTAKWTAIEYSIDYKLDGGKQDRNNPNTYTVEDSIKLYAPTKSGSRFDGWYLEDTFENKIAQIEAGSMGSLTLYAKWIPIDYTISYITNGGSNGGNITGFNATEAPFALKPGVKAGYKFLGWFTEETFENEKTEIDPAVDAKNISLYAKWELETYTIAYSLGGGKNASGNPTSYDVENEVTLAKPSKDGCTFAGWYLDSGFKTKVTSTSDFTGNVTLYAKWSYVKYSVTYKLNGGKNSTKNPSSFTIDTATVRLASPTRKGYTFGGWYKDAKFGTRVTEITRGSKGDLTLYAKWSLTKYKITYKLNKGKNSAKNPKTYTITTATIKLAKPTRKGYAFVGWYKDAKFKTKITKIPKGSTGNLTLYAKWKKK